MAASVNAPGGGGRPCGTLDFPQSNERTCPLSAQTRFYGLAKRGALSLIAAENSKHRRLPAHPFGAPLDKTLNSILIQGTSMPAPKELTEDLAPLVRRNALALSDTRWERDVEDLIKTLEGLLKN